MQCVAVEALTSLGVLSLATVCGQHWLADLGGVVRFQAVPGGMHAVELPVFRNCGALTVAVPVSATSCDEARLITVHDDW